MAFITRTGRASGCSVQSLLRRNFQPLFSPHQCQQQRSFTQRQLSKLSTNKLQIYKSTSTNPYINLSIEDHLLRNTPLHSTVLFLYKNRPCVVIGRNQNPWLELNLALCQKGITCPAKPQPQKIDIVRRRSGGGTVFHDEGNVNWTVISPKPGWKKDKHAEMVVRALKRLDISKGNPRVNERHDIVLDVDDDKSSYKISGSAYKVIQHRALHHGTCLLESPYLNSISEVLKSPAEPYIKANGVDSVRSPVCNVGIGTEEFIDAVVDEFKFLYDWDAENASYKLDENMLVHEDAALKVEKIKKGVEELMSDTWIYGQTPNFIFSTTPREKPRGEEVHPCPEDLRPRPPLPSHLPPKLRIFFQFRYGKCLKAGVFNAYHNMGFNSQMGTDTDSEIFKHKLYHIRTWEDIVVSAGALDESCGTPESRARDRHNIAMWLNHLLPPVVGTAVPSPPDVYE
ncbi:hypothetical protein QBC37DRAFT_422806 [Rhypophila decipiens]|uniref:Putative lipoate-protein ligase A n=1 Tax=Rhypophila decipiens TaxID=261697 RepID=A0AAN7B7F0_9PEZI|nr:hypothetical protein QBC37DRAFT_422806 [Rhypophila decipiens]